MSAHSPALDGRPLGSFEDAAALTHDAWPFVAVCVVRLEQGPDDETLRHALDRRQRETPLLGVRVTKDGGGRRFCRGAPRVPLEVRTRRGEDDWQSTAEEALNHKLDSATGPLLRAWYVRPAARQGPAEIVLAFHHTIIDAASGQAWIGELLRACAEPRLPDVGVDTALPPPTDALLPSGFRGLKGGLRRASYLARELAGELAHRVRSRRRGGARLLPTTATCRILPFEMAKPLSLDLIAEARQRRITLNSALAAALNIAVWRRRHRGVPMLLRTLAFTDLRAYLQPQEPASTLACHIAMVRYPIALRSQGFWEVARDFQQRLYDSARRGEKFLAASLTRHMMPLTLRSRSFRMAETALSYSGALQLEPAYGRLRVRGLHAFVSNIPMGPEFTALARLYEDRIQWDFIYLAEDMGRDEAAALAAEVMGTVEEAVGDRHAGMGELDASA